MLFYDDYKADFENSDLEMDRDDIIYASPLPTSAEAGKNSVRAVSDPTGSKGIKLAEYDRSHVEQWLELCEHSEKTLTIHLRVFLRLRRQYRHLPYHDGWSAKVQANYPYELSKELNKNQDQIASYMWVQNHRTFYEWWQRIVRVTMWEATRRGLIK